MDSGLNGVTPVIRDVSYFLAHVPGMVRHGSKPSREIRRDPGLLPAFVGSLRTFDDTVTYAAHQVFIGNLDPDDVLRISWYARVFSSSRTHCIRIPCSGTFVEEDVDGERQNTLFLAKGEPVSGANDSPF